MVAPKVRVDVTETHMADCSMNSVVYFSPFCRGEHWSFRGSTFSAVFGVGFWKSWAVWLASYVPMVVPVGRKYIEQFGIIPSRQIIILGRDLLIPGRPHAPQQLFRKRSSS
jgi:hypothetical protein